MGGALKDADKIKVMQDELNKFEQNSVWVLVTQTQGKTIIGTHWC